MQIRLQKIISMAGIVSRRKAEELILEGRVTLNGKTVRELGVKADPERDHIKVNGKLIRLIQPHVYIMLNKPQGYITSLKDPQGRPTVIEMLRDIPLRVYPVGRLDFNTEGLLLLTNDGELSATLMRPRSNIPKIYIAKVSGIITEKEIDELEGGIYLEDGKTAPCKIKKIRNTDKNSWIEITIHEGRRRQIRRMLQRVGHPVLKLKRTDYGPLKLDIPVGNYRYLTHQEVKCLKSLTKTPHRGNITRL